MDLIDCIHSVRIRSMSEEEFREFIREQTLRHEHATRTMDRWLLTVDRRVEEQIAELRSLRTEHQEESRAQRQALFAILDRLQDGPEPTPS